MRDFLIVGIVLIGAIWTLRRPWVGIMVWTWLSIMNPHRYGWGLAYEAPLAAITAIATLLGLLMTKERQSPFQGLPTVLLFLFAFWMTVSWLFGYDVSGDYHLWNRAIKICFMTFIALVLLYSKHHIMTFAWVTTGSLALLGAKGGLFTILTGGNHRVWGPAESFISDNNHMALALIMTIPLLRFLQLQMANKTYRMGMWGVIVLCAAAAVGSHSRGGLLAIAAMTVMFWWRSERNKLGIGALVLLGVFVALPMMPEHWWARMGTIGSYDEDASAMGRINAWTVAWEVAKHNFFGGGMSYQHAAYFMIYGVHETMVRAAHSIYFQILGNHGFIGLFIYLALWITTYRTAAWLRKNGKQYPQAKWTVDLGAMVQVSLVGYAVGGAFLSMPYFDLPYNMMVMVVLAKKWVELRRWEAEPQVSFLEYVGVKKRKVPVGNRQNSASPAG